MIEQRRKAQESLKAILEHIHQSLKWSWQIVMGFSLVAATQEVYMAIYEPVGIDYPVISACFFVFAFIPIFVRFYFGDSRYLDEHYLEFRVWKDVDIFMADLRAKLSKTRRALDIVLLLTHGIFFVFLAKSINNPYLFVINYFFLLVLNVMWLHIIARVEAKKNKKYGIEREENSIINYPRIWVINNIIHIVILGGILGFQFYYSWFENSVLYWWCLVIIASNSGWDLYLTRLFYFPDLNEEYVKHFSQDDK